MIFRARGFILDRMEGSMLENGLGIKCMGRGKYRGLMAGSMRGNMLMIRSMGMVFLNGLLINFINFLRSDGR